MKKQHLTFIVFLFFIIKQTNAQLSLNVGLYQTDVTGLSSLDIINVNNSGYPTYSEAGTSIDLKLAWHQKITPFFEFESGLSYFNTNHGVGFERENYNDIYYNYLKSVALPVALNGLLPISKRSNFSLSIGFTPYYILASDDGRGFNMLLSPLPVYSTSYKKWLHTLDVGIGYRLKVFDNHQIRIDLNYRIGLNHFVNDIETFPNNYISQLKTRNLGTSIGYIFQL